MRIDLTDYVELDRYEAERDFVLTPEDLEAEIRQMGEDLARRDDANPATRRPVPEDFIPF